MFNIQSPTFSSSSKIDLASKLSPSFRNKRIPSGQDNFTCHWNRVNSCKKLDSPSKSQKNRKRSHNSQHRVKTKINLSHNIVQQLNTLKNEYSAIKVAYQDLITSKVKNDEEINKSRQQIKQLKEENERILKENQKLRNKICFLEMEVERIKKESIKLIQIQQFKALKLEENLADKQKAISSLIESFKIDSSLQMSTPAIIQTLNDQAHNRNPTYASNNFVSLQSLTLSQDKTLSNSQFISISLTSMMQNESQIRQDLSTRRNNLTQIVHDKVNSEGSANNQNDKVQANVKSNKENEGKPADNFKKFRKEISKKIEVNIDQRNKEAMLVAAAKNGNGPLQRKNSKSNRNSKAKLKRDEESSEHRSSKKKIMNR